MAIEDTCVVHMVDNGDLEHDCNDHQVEGYHEVDGVPTSEPCPGVTECLDCQATLAQLPNELRELFWATRG